MSDTVDLSGKVAIVTGSSTGIGKETALSLARLGVKVALAARSEDVLSQVVEEIVAAGGTAIGVKTDVTCRDQVPDSVNKKTCLNLIELSFASLLMSKCEGGKWECLSVTMAWEGVGLGKLMSTIS